MRAKIDNRQNNGGHSTKAKGKDMRTRVLRDAIADCTSEEQLQEIMNMLYDNAIIISKGSEILESIIYTYVNTIPNVG